jgi:nucleoside-diphosphate-sugar epimerase
MQRLLIVGCGDVALRALALLRGHYPRIYALSHSPQRHAGLRAAGVLPVAGDLDDPATLGGLGGLADDILHTAPPPPGGSRDTRTAHLLAALSRPPYPGEAAPRRPARRLVYLSTSGVYGDCAGAEIDETRAPNPESDRARRRADAEARLRDWGRRNGVAVSILRVPGIYAAERLPLERLRAGTPALVPQDDGYTNHIHADDLARIVAAALRRGRPGRVYNACDDSRLRMGEYFDLVADRFGLPRPPRLPRAEAERLLSPAMLSFMRESRRLVNRRIKRELRVRLRYPTVEAGVGAAAALRPAG